MPDPPSLLSPQNSAGHFLGTTTTCIRSFNARAEAASIDKQEPKPVRFYPCESAGQGDIASPDWSSL